MKKKGLDIMDFALFSSLAYRDNSTTGGLPLLNNLTRDWFPGFDRVYQSKPRDLLQFTRYDETTSNVTVMAIRGTFGSWTALFDIDFYFGSLVYEYTNFILPISRCGPFWCECGLVDECVGALLRPNGVLLFSCDMRGLE